MKQKTLGITGLSLSELGIGTWEMSGSDWGIKDDRVSRAALLQALENGVNFIDTAADYGNGHAELLVGATLREWKLSGGGPVVTSTKVHPKCGVFAPPPVRAIDDFFPPDWISKECDASLSRLGTDHIDILFLHTWNRSWGHRTEWFEQMSELKRDGKIGAIGISIPDEGIADANVHIEGGRVDVVQCVFNIFQQEPEHTLFPLAQKHGVGIVARSPFSSGALVGNWTKAMTFEAGDWRGLWPQSLRSNWLEEQVGMADTVRRMLNGYPMPIAAIKYALLHEAVTSVIPGSADPRHVLQNIDAVSAPPLPSDVVQALKQCWEANKIHGTYNGSA